MSISNDSVTIITKPQLVNVDISSTTGDVDITTIPEFITVQVAASIQTSAGLFIIGEQPTGLINGSNATFNTLQSFVPETLQLFINGVSQTNGVDYYTTGTTTIILSVSPIMGDYIRANYKLG